MPDNFAMAGLFLAVEAVESKSIVDVDRELKISAERILKAETFLETQTDQPNRTMSDGMKRVGVHWNPCYERHDTGPGHPESAARYRVLETALATLPAEFVRLPGRRALVSEILLAHDHDYHDLVYRDTETFADRLRTGDTAICEESYDVALEASGAVLGAADAVMCGEVSSAFCAVRPPGHHATATHGMGFCIFNHVAVAARVDDPLGGLRWTDETFAEMTRRCVTLADQWRGGKIVSSLEGGYNLQGVASATLAHVRALTG